MQNQTQSVRLHYLDWLRAIAILMVFLFHAVHPFDFSGWHIKNAEQSEILTIILTLLGLWGMPFFFFVSGTGSWFALRRRTASEYASERFRRLFVPFIFGAIVFLPIMLYFEWVHNTSLGKWTMPFLTFALDRNVGFSPRWFGALGYHLWFLGFLFSFAILTLPLFQWFKREQGARLIARLANVSEHRGGILLLALPFIVVKLVLQPFFPIEHDWGDFTFQMSFFILGFVLFADQRFARAIRKDWWLLLTVGTAFVLALIVMYAMGLPIYTWGTTSTVPQFYLVHSMIAVIAFCYTLTMLFVGMRFLDFTDRWLAYGQEAVLPFFILHQPVIIAIAFYVVQWQTGILSKMLVVVAGSFIVCICLLELIIKRIGILRMLFGMTTSRQAQLKPIS